MAEIQRTRERWFNNVVQQQSLFSLQRLLLSSHWPVKPWYVMMITNKRIESAPTHCTYSSSLKGKLPKCWGCLQDILESRTRQQQQDDHNEWRVTVADNSGKERIATGSYHIINRGSIQHMCGNWDNHPSLFWWWMNQNFELATERRDSLLSQEFACNQQQHRGWFLTSTNQCYRSMSQDCCSVSECTPSSTNEAESVRVW